MKTLSEILAIAGECSSMQDAGRLFNIAHFVQQAQSIPGDICEFGTHEGKLAAFIACLTNRQLWLYDSFQGLPAKSTHDITRADFFPGQLKCDRLVVEERFKRHGLNPPVIVEKWFKDLTPDDLPHRISMAILDGDFYDSIMDSLRACYKRMTPGGIVCIDDYPWVALPGVKKATDDFLKDKPERLRLLMGPCEQIAHHVYFVKQ